MGGRKEIQRKNKKVLKKKKSPIREAIKGRKFEILLKKVLGNEKNLGGT